MPQTFMNLSGKAVLSLLTAHQLKPQNIIVVFDDVELPFGRLRFRRKGGSGGHKGIASVIEAIGPGFNRLRLGIEKPVEMDKDLTNHVLGKFSKKEEKNLMPVIEKAVMGIEEFIINGIDSAMEKFNLDPCS
jgi:PTH1 family peptidyl-tRNA hydrolase